MLYTKKSLVWDKDGLNTISHLPLTNEKRANKSKRQATALITNIKVISYLMWVVSYEVGKMAYDNNAPRKMYQGNWQCSKCQTAINELPFEPDPQRLGQLLCRDCHRERAKSFGGRNRFQR